MTRRTDAVEDMLDRLRDLADSQDRVSVGDVMKKIGNRGFGPFIFVPALVEETPLGGIPGVPTFFATIIAIFAVQLAMGRDHLWLPSMIQRRNVKASRLGEAATKLRPMGEWMDQYFGNRLERFAGPAASRLAGLAILLLCLTVPALEVIPFASSIPMLSIAFLGLAMTVRDGLLMLIGLVIALAAALAGPLLLMNAA